MMGATLSGTPVTSFTDAADDVRSGSAGTVPSVTGQSVEQAKATLRAAHLDPVVSDNQVYVSYAAAGTVAYSYPGNGASVYPGQRVVIYVSAGPPAESSSPPADTTAPSPGPGPGQPGPGNGNGNGNGGGGGGGGH
jgi:hypothetical protein